MGKDKHHRDWILRRCCGSIAACILTLAVLVGFIVLVIYLAIHPSKPSFYLQDVQLRNIDLSDPAISLNLQVTIASRNPNDRVGIYYKTLHVFTTYRDEPITVPVELPAIYQGHKDVSVWSPVMSGESVPVGQYVADAMKQDISAGYVLLHVKVDGRVKWKVGSWVSGGYHLFVTCPALLAASGGNVGGAFAMSATAGGVGAGNATVSLKFAQAADCTVDV
ncbi:NDR1/HIN1-like protein 1 [Oryza brachyantha]|uniref:NDR1/HIN1-like protein 1 n=1 Tax=Oryza brachyantha TaxID=4533 RepID=UPI0007767B03|nr:NDR1/HIN1-like protein 1 [Oryza brachyantha]